MTTYKCDRINCEARHSNNDGGFPREWRKIFIDCTEVILCTRCAKEYEELVQKHMLQVRGTKRK